MFKIIENIHYSRWFNDVDVDVDVDLLTEGFIEVRNKDVKEANG